MKNLPTGTVTFLFTDIEGSTRLLQDLGDAGYDLALADYRRLLRDAFRTRNSHEVETQGDGFLAVFRSGRDAIAATVAAQRAVAGHRWPRDCPVRVRMGLHTGEAIASESGYVGLDVHRAARICAAGHGGQILLSEATRGIVESDLSDGITLRDLGEHRLKDLARPHRLFQIVAPDLPADFPPLKALDVLPNNLPIQLTSFIGREKEIAEVKQLFSETRLLTLTGPGGVGKTRLALQVAADLAGEFSGGVWLVELAALIDAALIPQAVAFNIGIHEQAGRPILATLSDYLQPKRLLLLLDNCEHLLSGCAQVVETLLRTCPHLHVLATSRENLRIGGETVWLVPPLSTPDPRRPSSLGSLMQFEAARLFVERALAMRRTFAVTGENAVAVAQVCQRLDGLPLAIELAAARAKALTVEQIASRLEERSSLVTRSSRTAAPRHQTLRATMDWSHKLLSDEERILLRRLAVFVGGFTLEAAEAVCPGADRRLDALDLLTQLVDKSFVIAEERGPEVRYRLLETVRQYAREKLLEAGETVEVQRRHRDWCVEFAEWLAQKRWAPDQVVGLDRTETEHDNLRAALMWSLEEGGAEVALRLAGALGWFWYTRGYWNEGRESLRAALSLAANSPPAARAKALYWAARLAGRQQDRRTARSLYDESLALYRRLGSKQDIAVLLNDLGLAAQFEGEYDAARAFDEESLAIFRQLNDRHGSGWALLHLSRLALFQGDVETARSNLGESLTIFRELGSKNGIASALRDLGGLALHQGDYEAARRHYEESLAIFRELGNKGGMGEMLERLGGLARNQGDYAAARPLYEESLAIFRDLGDRMGVAWTLSGLGRLARQQGDYSRADVLHQEGLAIFRSLGETPGIGWALKGLADVERSQGDHGRAAALYSEALTLQSRIGVKEGVAECVEGFAALAAAEGQPLRAAQLFGAAEALSSAMGNPLPPADRVEHDRNLAAVRTELGDVGFAEAWSKGRAMTLEQAIEYALKVGESDAVVTHSPHLEK